MYDAKRKTHLYDGEVRRATCSAIATGIAGTVPSGSRVGQVRAVACGDGVVESIEKRRRSHARDQREGCRTEEERQRH